MAARLPRRGRDSLRARVSEPAEASTRAGSAAPPDPRVGSGISISSLWAFLAVALPTIAALAARLRTSDLAYQIRAGEVMARTHSILRTDTFSFTRAGRPWLNQQWGGELLFGIEFRAGGWLAMVVARAALIGLVSFFVYRGCRARGAEARPAAWLTLAAVIIATTAGGSFALRPQLIAAALFALTLFLIADRQRHPARLWAIAVLVAAWSNVHGSFLLGPVLLGIAWVEDRHEHRPQARRTLLIALVSLGATLLNPFGIRVWSYAVDLSTNPTLTKFISEWQPPTIRDSEGLAFFTSFVLVCAFVARRRRAIPWPTLLWLGSFFALGLLAERTVVWWALTVPVVLARDLSGFGSRPDEPRSPVNLGIASAVLLLGVFFIVPWWGMSRTMPNERLVGDAPVGISSALARTLRPGDRIFATSWAAWFELVLPGNPVFVDSRIELFPPSIWAQYEEVRFRREGWQGVLDRWSVAAVVVAAEDPYLLPALRNDSGWRLAYDDSEGSVFVRTTGA